MNRPVGRTERWNRVFLVTIGALVTLAGAYGIARASGAFGRRHAAVLTAGTEDTIVEHRTLVLVITLVVSVLVVLAMVAMIRLQIRRWSYRRHDLEQRSPAGAPWRAIIPAKTVEESFAESLREIGDVVDVSAHATPNDAPSVLDARVTLRTDADLRDLEPHITQQVDEWAGRILVGPQRPARLLFDFEKRSSPVRE